MANQAKKPSKPMWIVNAFGADVKFGATDKVQKLPLVWQNADDYMTVHENLGAAEVQKQEYWRLVDLSKDETPDAVGFVGKNGKHYVAYYKRYPSNIRQINEFHGSKQKLGDEYADVDEVDDCLEAARALDEQLASGKWYAERTGFSGISVLMRAIMKVFGQTEEQAREFLKPLSVKEKQALRVCDELKATIAEIEAEKGKGTDVSNILAKLKPAA